MRTSSWVPLDQIQGNVTPGFRKDFQAFVFLRFPDDPTKARAWLDELHPCIVSAAEVAHFRHLYRLVKRRTAKDENKAPGVDRFLRSTWVNVAFTAKGLVRLLGHRPWDDDGPLKDRLEAFRKGMCNRTDVTGDPLEAIAKFRVRDSVREDRADFDLDETMERQQVAHALVMIGADRPWDLDGEIVRQIELAGRHDLDPFFRLHGRTLGDRREHFGFRDGISQPDPDDPLMGWRRDPGGEQIVAPGEFIVGCEVEPAPVVEPQPPAPPESVAALVAAPTAGSGAPPTAASDGTVTVAGAPGHATNAFAPNELDGGIAAWERYGSYLVFRRYTQNLAALQTTVQAGTCRLLEKFPDATPELFEAKLMGRWKSGAKLGRWDQNAINQVKDPEEPGKEVTDHMTITGDYFTGDVYGDACPLFSHIRKAHPRGRTQDSPQKHRIIRRGITYDYGGEEGKGLLFLAYQASIEQGFEHIQATWFNDSTFPKPELPGFDGTDEPGPDPLVGQVKSKHVIRYPVPERGGPGSTGVGTAGSRDFVECHIETLVTLKDGAYFFSPSIGGLVVLAQDDGRANTAVERNGHTIVESVEDGNG